MHPRKLASRNVGQLLTDTLSVEKNFAKLCLGWVEKSPPSGKAMLGPGRKGCRTGGCKGTCSFSGAPHTAGPGHQALSSGPAVERCSLSGET